MFTPSPWAESGGLQLSQRSIHQTPISDGITRRGKAGLNSALFAFCQRRNARSELRFADIDATDAKGVAQLAWEGSVALFGSGARRPFLFRLGARCPGERMSLNTARRV